MWAGGGAALRAEVKDLRLKNEKLMCGFAAIGFFANVIWFMRTNVGRGLAPGMALAICTMQYG